MTDGLLFANLVDFDTLFGHRRDPDGYAAALIAFDRWLENFLPHVSPHDLLIITADHGNDPNFAGTDHTREQVPLMVCYKNQSTNLGARTSFADIAASLSLYFGLTKWNHGESFLDRLKPDPLGVELFDRLDPVG